MNNMDIEKMIENGELGSLTECAYGQAIADDENTENRLKKKISK